MTRAPAVVAAGVLLVLGSATVATGAQEASTASRSGRVGHRDADAARRSAGPRSTPVATSPWHRSWAPWTGRTCW